MPTAIQNSPYLRSAVDSLASCLEPHYPGALAGLSRTASSELFVDLLHGPRNTATMSRRRASVSVAHEDAAYRGMIGS